MFCADPNQDGRVDDRERARGAREGQGQQHRSGAGGYAVSAREKDASNPINFFFVAKGRSEM